MSTPDVTTPDVTPPDVTPTRAVVSLRRAASIAACLGAVSFVVLAIAGHPLAAVCFCGGLGLGLFNTALVQRSAARFAASGDPNKRRFAVSVLARLTLITGLAVGLALALRPEGLAVFAGLAALQLLMIFMASVPLIKELRRSGVGRSGVGSVP
ncbi:MAG: ATP synthase subunit I [Pseudonocardiaceae bacterium]